MIYRSHDLILDITLHAGSFGSNSLVSGTGFVKDIQINTSSPHPVIKAIFSLTNPDRVFVEKWSPLRDDPSYYVENPEMGQVAQFFVSVSIMGDDIDPSITARTDNITTFSTDRKLTTTSIIVRNLEPGHYLIFLEVHLIGSARDPIWEDRIAITIV